MTEQEQLLRRAYDAFNARDIDTALACAHADVDWPNGMEGGREHGRAAVRDYWTRQFAEIDGRVEPIEIAETDDGRVSVTVHQTVRSLEGEILSDGRVGHVYTIRDGRIAHMEVVETD